MRDSEYKVVISGFGGTPTDESISGFGSYRGEVITGEADAYKRAPLIYRALRLRCNGLTRIPCYVYADGEEPIGKYIFEDSLPLRNLLWLAEASILLKGAAYILKNQNIYKKMKGLQYLNPFTIESKYIDGEMKFKQYVNGERYPKGKEWWDADEMLYFREYNPTDDLGAGVSAVQVALGDSQTLAGVSRFLGNFFTGDGIPITMITMPGNTQEAERDRVENWFKQRMRQMRNSITRVLGIKGDLKIEKLTDEIKSFAIDEVDGHSLKGISDAFEIPQSMLRSDAGANRSISDNDKRTFLENTLIPRAAYYESVLNPFLKEFGQRIEFVPQELPEMQDDETVRAASLKQLVDSGVPLIAALDILGYDISDSSMRIIRKEYRTKNRERINILNGPKKDEQDEEDENNPQIKTEIDKWYRKSLKRMKAGKSADVEFESDIIPDELMEQIEKALKAVKSENELKAVFGGSNGTE